MPVTADLPAEPPSVEPDATQVAHWVSCQTLGTVEVDCATAVMLKILDGKCKMKPVEKVVMTHLYDQLKDRPGKLLPSDIHSLIATARQCADEAMKDHIYEKRVLAETMISRPVMKGFKAMIRSDGLFAGSENSEEVAK